MRLDARHTSTAVVALLAALFLAPHAALAQTQDDTNASILNVKNLDLSFAPTSATSDDTVTSPSPSPMRAQASGVGIGIKFGPLFSTLLATASTMRAFTSIAAQDLWAAYSSVGTGLAWSASPPN